MVESSHAIASDEDARVAAIAKMGGKVGSVDWIKKDDQSAAIGKPHQSSAHLDHSDRSSISWPTPVPFHEFASDSTDAKQTDTFALQPPDFTIGSFDVALVQIQICLRERRLVRKDEMRQERRRLARVPLFRKRERRRESLRKQRLGSAGWHFGLQGPGTVRSPAKRSTLGVHPRPSVRRRRSPGRRRVRLAQHCGLRVQAGRHRMSQA